MRLIKLSVLMATMLFGAVMLMVILSIRGLPASQRGGGSLSTATVNGDVNCDGVLDISDPIYLLFHLFATGPEPCALSPISSSRRILPCMLPRREKLNPLRPPRPFLRRLKR